MSCDIHMVSCDVQMVSCIVHMVYILTANRGHGYNYYWPIVTRAHMKKYRLSKLNFLFVQNENHSYTLRAHTCALRFSQGYFLMVLKSQQAYNLNHVLN